MQSISFDEGYKEFCVNGDENRVVRFNPKDFGIVTRMQDTLSDFSDLEKKLKESTEDTFAGVLKEAEETVYEKNIRSEINRYFGYSFRSGPGSKVLLQVAAITYKEAIDPPICLTLR